MKFVGFESRIWGLGRGLRNGFAISPAEQTSNLALIALNKKAPARGLELMLCE